MTSPELYRKPCPAMPQYRRTGLLFVLSGCFLLSSPRPGLTADWTAWGSQGSGLGEFDYPDGVGVDSEGNIYVADGTGGNNRIQKRDVSTGTWSAWTGFSHPRDVKVDSMGNIYVADSHSHSVKKRDATTGIWTTWQSGFSYPTGVAIDSSGNVYVASAGNDLIRKRDATTGVWSTIASGGSQPGQVRGPCGVHVDAAGNLYVTEGSSNDRVQMRAASTGTWTILGTSGSAVGQFNEPRGIVVDAEGNVYVGDAYNHRIQIRDASDGTWSAMGSKGSALGEFNTPKKIDLDEWGNLYVADTHNHRIQKWDRTAHTWKLVAHYPLNGSGQDASSYANHGAVHGSLSYIDHGAFGQGGRFDQKGSKYIEVAHAAQLVLSNAFTVSFWYRRGSTDDGRILQKHYPTDHSHGNCWEVLWADPPGSSPHAIYFSYAWPGSGGNYENLCPLTPDGGDWHHIAYTYDSSGNVLRGFLDGSERVSDTPAHSVLPLDTTLSLLLMDDRHTFNSAAEGDLDEVRIYNRALDSDDVRQLYTGSYQQEGRTVVDAEDNSPLTTAAHEECSTGSPVFLRAGGYRSRADDAVLPTRGLPLQITRFYNSIDEYDGPFSHGWCFNQTVQLIRTAATNGEETAIIRWANGVRKDFTLTNGVYQAPLGCYDRLATNATGFLLTIPSGMAMQFNEGGFLVSQADRNGNTVTYEQDLQNRISRVTSADSRTLDYHYNPTNNRVSKVEDWAGRAWRYGYSTNDDLVSVTYPDGAIVRYTYDASHNLTGTYDARSNLVSSLTHDADADKTTSYAEGSAVNYSFTYDPASNTTHKTDSLNREWSFQYNQYGNKENLVNPAGHEVQFTWTGSQEISSKTDPRGYPQHFQYDDRGNVVSVSNALGHVTRYTYETNFNQVTSITDPLGNVVSNRYDAQGNLIWSQDARGFVTEFHYDSFGQLTNAVDARSHATAMTYNPHGDLLNVTDPLGYRASYTYNDRGNRVTMTDARGNIWRYGYDTMDRLVAVTNPLGHATSYTYDANGNRTSVTDARSNTTRFQYDEYNRLDSVSNALGYATTYEYDIYGSLVGVRDALGNVVSNTYDEINRLASTTDPLGNPTSFTYDDSGNRKAVTDAMTNSTRYAFDPLNRVASMTNAVGGVWEYAYDANHNLLSVTDARDKTSENQYDARNMVTNSANALGHAYRYEYDENGNAIQRTDPNGAALVYSYDEANRLTSIAYPNGTSLVFDHDENGNVTALSNATETVRYWYDSLNRVTNVVVVGLGKAVSYEYDAVGNRAAMIDPDGGRTEYDYDPLNRLTSLTDPGSNTWTFAYDAINRMTNMTMPNGIVATYQYDPGSRLTNLVYRNSTNAVLQSFTYTYDAVGNPVSVEREDNLYELYRYDDTYQLIRVDYDATNAVAASTNWTEYIYDLVGNRLTLTREGETETYEYDDANRLLSVTSASSVVTFGWDDNGNMTNKTENGTNTWYAWDYENKLVRITYHDGSTNAFSYYPSSSLRHTKVDSSGTNRFVYDGQNLLQELDDLGTLVAQYQYSLGIDSLLARTTGGGQQYYLRDIIGSVTAVADVDEDLLSTYRYDAFGAVRRQTGGVANPHLFTSRRLDQDSGLYYYRARFLMHSSARFISPDPVPTANRYAYVKNRPTSLADPLGLLEIELPDPVPSWDRIQQDMMNMDTHSPLPYYWPELQRRNEEAHAKAVAREQVFWQTYRSHYEEITKSKHKYSLLGGNPDIALMSAMQDVAELAALCAVEGQEAFGSALKSKLTTLEEEITKSQDTAFWLMVVGNLEIAGSVGSHAVGGTGGVHGGGKLDLALSTLSYAEKHYLYVAYYYEYGSYFGD